MTSMKNIQTDCELMPHFNKRPTLTPNNETGWKRLVKDIVRPPRMIYSEKDLGISLYIQAHNLSCLTLSDSDDKM